MTEGTEQTPDHPEPPPEVEGDPTVVYVPLEDRAGHPLTKDEASHVAGVSGYALVVEKGPRTGMTYVLPHGNITVGRHPESDIFLNDVTVSRQHRDLVRPNMVGEESRVTDE